MSNVRNGATSVIAPVAESEPEPLVPDNGTSTEEFVELISHELKNRLTLIIGNGTMLMEPVDSLSEPGARQALRQLMTAASSLNQAIDNLLVLTRLKAGSMLELEPVHLAHLVTGVVEAWQDGHPGVVVSIDRYPTVPLVLAAPGHLAIVLENMLSNAHKYSPPGSKITVVVRRGRSNCASVRVLDRGIGILGQPLADLFTPFHRSIPARKMADGMGLGMALSRRILEAQGGSIYARPRPGGGSEFSFILPALSLP